MLTSTRAVADLSRFYESLGLLHPSSSDIVELHVGETVIQFSPIAGEREPFYHFAVRVPRNRLAAAAEWLSRRTPLLPDPETGATRFEFENWNATAYYAHDPAGNIVEIIAHRELPEKSTRVGAFSAREVLGAFSAREVLGVCEAGLVGDDAGKIADALKVAGLRLWDGSLEPGRLAFMGERDGLLIIAPTGRGWLPTGRPALPYPVYVEVDGTKESDVTIPQAGHLVRVCQQRVGPD